MKKIFFYLAIVLMISCAKDEDTKVIEQPTNVPNKELKPSSIVVKQGDDVVDNLLTDNKITLPQGKSYTIFVTFAEDVELQKGEFKKMKAKNNREFYADFYGKNINEIDEITSFKKEGYTDYSLQITQSPIIPNYYISLDNVGYYFDIRSYALADEDKKTIWIRNTMADGYTTNAEIEFIGPVFLENVLDENGQNLIEVSKNDDEGAVYNLKITNTTITQNPDKTIVLPIYQNLDGEKGSQIGELTFKGDFEPFCKTSAFRPDYIDTFVHSYRNRFALYFFIQGRATNVYIDNVNTELIDNYVVHPTTTGRIDFYLKDDAIMGAVPETRIFDYYEGTMVNGEIVKKDNAVKKEFFYVKNY